MMSFSYGRAADVGQAVREIAANPSAKFIAGGTNLIDLMKYDVEATIRVAGPSGERTLPFGDFHRLPGDTPEVDTNLSHGEIILSVDLPARGFARHHTYLKLRDRSSYVFALVSVAAGLEMEGDRIRVARLALGGVAHKPWRDPEAEELLSGGPATTDSLPQPPLTS
jgi:xanthine dehydrogenase YagS FAD-binding subunit